MSNFLLTPETTFLNTLCLGSDVGPQTVDPQLRQIIATNRTKKAVERLADVQQASLHGQRQALQMQALALREQHQLTESVDAMEQSFSDGLDRVSSSLQNGFSGLADGMEAGFSQLSDGMSQMAASVDVGMRGLDRTMRAGTNAVVGEIRDASMLNLLGMSALNRNLQDGFETLGLGMQSGFEALVQVVSDGNEQLANCLTDGFNAVLTQSAEQHQESITTLWRGFNSVQQSLGQVAQTIVAVGQHTAQVMAASTDALLAGQREQTSAILSALDRQSQQLAEVNRHLQHQSSNAATEHFVVGMRFLNQQDIPHALEQFAKARRTYGGHFPTLFAEGFCWYVLGQSKQAEDRFIAALSQTAPDPRHSRRQQSHAALYLGRLSFDRQDYAAARDRFRQAYRLNPQLRSALIEGAASLLLDPARPANAALGVKQEFNACGEAAYLMWYRLALTLAALAPEIAVEAFRQGLAGGRAVHGEDRVEVIALLWRLNPRTTGPLLELLAPLFPWLA